MKLPTAMVALAFALTAPQAHSQHADDVFVPAGPVGTIVAGVPFSAITLTTWDFVTRDGIRIRGESHGKVYRDSQGRTRIETEPEGPDPALKGVVFVSITDPLSKSIVHLNTGTKRALVTRLPSATQAASETPVRQNSKLSIDSDEPPSLAQVLASARPFRQSEDLGSREIEGLTVTGTKVTEDVTFGVIQGGGGTFRVATTSWVSTELKVAVVTDGADTRSNRLGANNRLGTKMTNFVRGEPDASLFQIPPGYTVIDQRRQN